MNDREQEDFQNELSRVQPGKAPEELMHRIMASLPPEQPRRRPANSVETDSEAWWMPWMRWLAPVGAVGLVLFITFRQFPMIAQAHVISADSVELDQELKSSFDAVGELPNGEPIRFRCLQWEDTAVFRDTGRGVVLEQRTPRLEIVIVDFDTY